MTTTVAQAFIPTTEPTQTTSATESTPLELGQALLDYLNFESKFTISKEDGLISIKPTAQASPQDIIDLCNNIFWAPDSAPNSAPDSAPNSNDPHPFLNEYINTDHPLYQAAYRLALRSGVYIDLDYGRRARFENQNERIIDYQAAAAKTQVSPAPPTTVNESNTVQTNTPESPNPSTTSTNNNSSEATNTTSNENNWTRTIADIPVTVNFNDSTKWQRAYQEKELDALFTWLQSNLSFVPQPVRDQFTNCKINYLPENQSNVQNEVVTASLVNGLLDIKIYTKYLPSNINKPSDGIWKQNNESIIENQAIKTAIHSEIRDLLNTLQQQQ